MQSAGRPHVSRPAVTDVEGPGLVTEADAPATLFIARQPIFTTNGQLHGYELLHRAGHVGGADLSRGDDELSSEVLVNAFLSIGIARLTGNTRAFVNFSDRLLLDGVHTVLHPSTTVIEVLERVRPSDEILAACQAIVEQGYTLALDDFVFSDDIEPLLHMAQVVKVDVMAYAPDDLERLAERLARWPLALLAERVETSAMRDQCRTLGFRYFQGYYFARPEVMEHRKLSPTPLAIMRLIAMLRDERTCEADIERAFQGNVALTVRLLRAVNSVAVGGRGISSIRHGVRMLGHGELGRWLSLMLVTSSAPATGADAELIFVALRRARMCEVLAAASGHAARADAAFIAGMFSLLDVVLKAPMPELMAGLELSRELSVAIQRREGVLGRLLETVDLFEQGAWDGVMAEADALGITPSVLSEAYAGSTDWARQRLAAPDIAG